MLLLHVRLKLTFEKQTVYGFMCKQGLYDIQQQNNNNCTIFIRVVSAIVVGGWTYGV